MQTTKELSKEIADFCRITAFQHPKSRVTQAGIGKAVLQGIMIALLAVSASSCSGNPQARGGPWIVGD